MKEKNRNSIEIEKMLPRFTTMNVIDGQAGLMSYSSLIFYSLTIDNILNIIVLLILAGVTIATLMGDNGILTKATTAKENTEIGQEKEYIKLSVSAIRGEKISNGDTSEITSKDLQKEINNYTDQATVTGSGTLTVKYKSGRIYEVEQDGNIKQKEEAKKIINAIAGCENEIIIETEDGTVYRGKQIQDSGSQKIEIPDEEIITTKGIREAGESYFIDNEGKVYTWGNNLNGQLGNGTDIDGSDEPICISEIEGNALNGKDIVDFETDGFVIVTIDSEGKVYTWGAGTTQEGDSNIPICISEIEGNALKGKKIVKIQTDGSTTVAIDNEGKVYTWGGGWYGQLGNGQELEYSDEPICISEIEGNALNGKKIEEVQFSYEAIMAIDDIGKVYTWGSNEGGQLGDGTAVEYSNKPTCISEIEGNSLKGKEIVKIKTNGYTIIAIDNEGKIYTWGGNGYGNLENKTEVEYSNKPICISEIEGNAINGKNIEELQIVGNTIIAMDDEVKVYTWGYNEHGELGNGTNIEYSNEPICISEIEENALNGKKIVEVQNYYGATILAIDSEGKAYTWGMNLYDQLGNGANIEYSNVPICITDNKKLELYGRKIKKKFMYMLQNCGVQLYLTQEGELYAYSYFWPV